MLFAQVFDLGNCVSLDFVIIGISYGPKARRRRRR